MSQTVEQQQVETASVRDGESSDKKQKSRRPPNTAFRQQRLKAWQPILTPKTVLPLFFAVGAIFAPIGGLLIYASSQVQEISIDYSDCNTTAPACPQYETIPSGKTSSYFKTSPDNIPKPTWCRDTTEVGYGVDNFLTVTTPTCHLQFNIPENLEAPVLLYYRLTNFYQNHRRYVKSFDQDQLKGNARDAGAINGSDCDPLEGAKDPIDGIFKPYYPCGLIANSLFNDTISEPVLLNPSGTSMDNMTYPMTTNGTAWSSDGDLYHATNYSLGAALPPPNWRVRYPTYNESFPYPSLHTDDHFQVWMRTAGLPTFSKLYRRNDDQTMEAGNYEITIYDSKFQRCFGDQIRF